jgi:hypothetical protein
MNRTTGIATVVVGGILVLCCGGGLLMVKSSFESLQEVLAQDKEFVRDALTQTGSTWDVKKFNEFAVDTFKEPANVTKTEKMFTVFNQKLGKLQLLEEVNPSKSERTFEIARGKTPGMMVTLEAKGKFEKGRGVFVVKLMNTREKSGKNTPKIMEIKLNSNEVFDLSKEEAEKAKPLLDKATGKK